ncbi:hypothetical protein [Kribbella sp. VKM Ac-2569]|uniref:hypothetical protein n=1 Tax=Kribbella sp. VKM Ac-2569 TaxID=2512220 RepID=UPI00102B3A4A|nr:hypothetical protein [Kribbella sp. VKM Ac-2569]
MRPSGSLLSARSLGILFATLDDTFDPDKVVITGDGIAVTELGSTGCVAAISQYRNPANGPVTIDVEPFEFTERARAGAILAIRSYLAYGTHLIPTAPAAWTAGKADSEARPARSALASELRGRSA